MPNLKGKTAVVTGASSGIGTAIAKELAADGASVVVNYMSNKARAEQIVEEIRESGGGAIALGGNVANQSEVTALFSNVKDQYGKLDILIDNAGVAHRATLDEITEEACLQYQCDWGSSCHESCYRSLSSRRWKHRQY
jgi:3-oxoacyl-[acyl-carrier protein] reductase